MASLKSLCCLAILTLSGGVLGDQGSICYCYTSSVSESLQRKIEQAMDIWMDASCLNFTESCDNEDCIEFYSHPNEEYFTSTLKGQNVTGVQGTSYSVFDREIEQQKVSLGYSYQSVKDLLYILGLIIGLQTEQNRPDRDRYVRIQSDNIEPGQEANFAVSVNPTTGYQGVEYDYASIMHLSASAYSESGEVTTEVTNHKEYIAQGRPKLGNRQRLSPGDVLKVNRLHNCPGVGRCEDLRIYINGIQDLSAKFAASYHLEAVGVDSLGRMQNISSSVVTSNSPGSIDLIWNETLQFPISTTKFQFFRIALKSQEDLMSTVITVPLEEGKSSLLHHDLITPLGTAKLSFSYECIADGNDCNPSPCVSATRCNDGLFGYTCDCLEGYGGKDCNIHCSRGYSGYNCTDDISGDSCASNPCTSGHTESCTDGFFDYTCTCRTGFGGRNCEIECPRGYSGRNCNEDISGDSCQPNPCHSSHSHHCVDGIYNYTCLCITGFGGKNCNRVCPHGYGGMNCDVDVSGNSCLSNPCHVAHTRNCSDGFFDYTCTCHIGYGGKNCQIVCPRGYDGYNCDIDISNDSCSPNPCHSRNTIQCIDGFFDYTCNCRAGYGGKTCHTDLCASGRCNSNGGTCVPYSSSPNYRCNCPLAWTPASQCTRWEPRCLQIVVKYARGLSDRDGWFRGDSDPYTDVRAYTSNSQHSASTRTRYIQGDESPDWNHVFNAGCGHSWDRFYFRIYDSDPGSDDALSSGQTVSLKSLRSLPACRLTIGVQGGSGTITFDVYYYSQYGTTGLPGSCR